MICIIPARGGSKRIPRKNIKPFLGVPVIARTIRMALSSGLFDRILVSTDDTEIGRIAWEAGADVLRRPDSLAQDGTITADTLLHALLSVNECRHVCCLYPAAVFTTPGNLLAGRRVLYKEGRCHTRTDTPGDADAGQFYFENVSVFKGTVWLPNTPDDPHILIPGAIDINTPEEWAAAEERLKDGTA